MMLRKIYDLIIGFGLIFLLSNCDSVNDSTSNTDRNIKSSKNDDWLVPNNEVFDGGPGRDGIPALTNPDMIEISNASYLGDDDLVIIAKGGSEVRIYPHKILDWHEIINDNIGDNSFAITYCPLTGSGISWDRIIDGSETTFGVSGLLYNTNLIPYDRKTESNWSQMRLQSINGELISTFIKIHPIIETSWETAKSYFPEAKVISINTGYARNYFRYPYGDYRTNHSTILFPVNNSDSRLSAKDRVLGVIFDNRAKAYRIEDFQNAEIIIDSIGTEKLLIYGNNKKNIIVAFELSEEFSGFNFTVTDKRPPYIIDDDAGRSYDIFGYPNKSGAASLKQSRSFVAYWFAWAAFYPNTELYQE